MTKSEMQTKIEALKENEKILKENIEYYEKIIEIVTNRLHENIDYINENLKKEKVDSKKKLLLGLKDEFSSIKNVLTEGH